MMCSLTFRLGKMYFFFSGLFTVKENLENFTSTKCVYKTLHQLNAYIL